MSNCNASSQQALDTGWLVGVQRHFQQRPCHAKIKVCWKHLFWI